MEIHRGEGLIFNHKKIARIKRKFNLKTKIRRANKYRYFALKKQEHEFFPNLLNRKFKQTRPDIVYSTDITQLWIGNKKGYIAVVKDLCTKEIVAANVSANIDVNLTNGAIKKAIGKLNEKQKRKLMIHSDQGFHFTHYSYRDLLRNNNITQSMSRKGNCYDNAPVESFFGILKDHIEIKKCKTIEDLKKEVTKKIKYYNFSRPQLGLKKMPPYEYRRHIES